VSSGRIQIPKIYAKREFISTKVFKEYPRRLGDSVRVDSRRIDGERGRKKRKKGVLTTAGTRLEEKAELNIDDICTTV